MTGHFCRKYETEELAFAALQVYIRPPVLTESSSTISKHLPHRNQPNTLLNSSYFLNHIKMSDYTGPGLYEILPKYVPSMSLNVWGAATTAGTQVKL